MSFRKTCSTRLPILLALVAVTLMVAMVGGCSLGGFGKGKIASKLSLRERLKEKEEQKLPPAGPTTVLTDASALALQLPDTDVQLRGRFHEQFDALTGEGRTTAVDILVARQSDRAYEILSSQRPGTASSLSALAASYDRFCRTRQGWQTVIAAGDTQAVRDYFQMRAKWMGEVSTGNFAATQEMDLIATAERASLRPLMVDAWYQTGVGAMLRGDNAAAASAFKTCAQSAGDEAGTIGANAMLLCSEASRRYQDHAGANAAWNDSVSAACRLLATRGVSEPSYWERAAYLHPVNTPWPSEIGRSFNTFVRSGPSALQVDILRQLTMASTSSQPITAQCWIEAAIGGWQHERGDMHQALVRFKKAETLATKDAADWLKIAQAKQLVALGQVGTATTVLTQVIARDDRSPMMLAAQAELGVIRLQSEAVQHGVRLLKESLDGHPAVQWPGRSSLEADYALGLLMLGDVANGKRKLYQVQRRFESEGEYELLAKSLFNEWKYLEHTEAPTNEVREAQHRLEAMRL